MGTLNIIMLKYSVKKEKKKKHKRKYFRNLITNVYLDARTVHQISCCPLTCGGNDLNEIKNENHANRSCSQSTVARMC